MWKQNQKLLEECLYSTFEGWHSYTLIIPNFQANNQKLLEECLYSTFEGWHSYTSIIPNFQANI